MRPLRLIPALILCLVFTESHGAEPVSLFDGKTFTGWEGDTQETWRIVDGVIVGGSLEGNPQNEFLATKEEYGDFHLQLEYKLVGTEGFVNGGVQIRSERMDNPPNEMKGYQADIGKGYSGFLYDESRRKKFLAEADPEYIQRIEKEGEWNEYEVVARGSRIQIFLNGQRTINYFEREKGIPETGLIALQIHGNCRAEISFRNIRIEKLPEPGVPPQEEILARFGSSDSADALPPFLDSEFTLGENETIVFMGQENLVRDSKTGALEALLATAYAEKKPRFRSMAWEADTVYEQWRDLNFGSWSEQLKTAEATVAILQFGQMEALDGPDRIAEFTTAYHVLLDQVAQQTRRIVLVSPMLFEKPEAAHAPDLTKWNEDVRAYAAAIEAIAKQRGAIFIDLAKASDLADLTSDGIHLTEKGLETVAHRIASELRASPKSLAGFDTIKKAIVRKNEYWFDCWRPANWSFVYGDRVNQLYGKGSDGEPSLKNAFEQQLRFVAEADEIIHQLANGKNVAIPEPEIISDERGPEALSPEEQRATFKLADGYEVNLFASEADGVVNPTQFAWDEKGRLYVACSPSYPQSLASMPPRDYVLRLTDTNGDGQADKSERFIEGLTMVQGVEPGAGGVYVCDFDQLLHFRDTDTDGVADEKTVIFSGFGVGDTHQLINSICHGPDGSLWFSQGLHAMSRVETPHGIARLDRAAIWRFRPRELKLEGFFGGGMAGANCWGIAFDDFGQVFHKSGDRPHGYWSVPGMVNNANPRGSGSDEEASASYRASPEQYHAVGPLFATSPKTTAIDIIGTQAMPKEIQGCALIGGYFGSVVELHRFSDAGSGYKTEQLPRLMTSTSNAFRPVDVSAGPDGAIYLADWYNPVIGHYQASYADARRDRSHGRIWRITSKNHLSVKAPPLADYSPAELLDALKSPERWVRYQAKRLLFDLPEETAIAAADRWVETTEDERALREVIGVYQAHHTVRPELLQRLLDSEDARIRAYATRVLGQWGSQIDDAQAKLLTKAADSNPRVRLESAVAATYLPEPASIHVVTRALEKERDPFLDYAVRQSARSLQNQWAPALREGTLKTTSDGAKAYLEKLLATGPKLPSVGEDLYAKACLACHQPDGKGLPGIYPPLVNSQWVTEDEARLIKIVLHGLAGPIEVAGTQYGNTPQSVPMPALGGLSDQEVADVLNHVRETYGKKEPSITVEEVKAVREKNSSRTGPWTAETLNKSD